MIADPPPVLLLAAGLGTRLRPLTERVPKCLAPVAGRPLLDYWQDRFVRHGIVDAIVNVHSHPDQVRAWVDEQDRRGPVTWEVFEEPELLGSAGTVRENLARLERSSDFLVIYADNVSTVDLGALVRAHREREAAFTMALFHTPTPDRCGIATLEQDARISAFVEKPEQPVSDLANAGIYAISRGALAGLLGSGFQDMAFDVLPRLVGRMHGFVLHGYHRDVGDLAALKRIEADVAAGVLDSAGERAD